MKVDKTKQKICRLEDICVVRTGRKDANHASDNGEYPFFTCGINPLKSTTYSFDGENLIIPGNGDIGRCFYYNGKIEAYQRTYVLHLKENSNIDIKYLYLVFKAGWKLFVKNKILGAAMPYIKLGHLNSFPITIYELGVQKVIATELDSIQTIIDGYKAQLEDLDALAQSIFLDMFGDPITNPKEWVIDKLGNHIIVIGGYAFKSGSFLESGIPVLRIGNINSGVFKKDNLVFWQEDNKLLRYKIYPGDLVISLTGTVGKSDYANVCILDRSYPMYYLNQRNAKLELSNDIGKSYLTWLLKHKHIKNKLTKISRGIRQANMSNKDIEELIIPLPPLTLQQDFANQVEAIEKQKELIKSQLADAETLMAERMQYYFS